MLLTFKIKLIWKYRKREHKNLFLMGFFVVAGLKDKQTSSLGDIKATSCTLFFHPGAQKKEKESKGKWHSRLSVMQMFLQPISSISCFPIRYPSCKHQISFLFFPSSSQQQELTDPKSGCFMPWKIVLIFPLMLSALGTNDYFLLHLLLY